MTTMSKHLREHLATKYGIYNIRDLENHYRQNKKGHFFDKDTMRFFGSRLSEKLFYRKNDILFITSERGPVGPRRWTIRSYTPESANIEDASEFQKYKTPNAAYIAAHKMATLDW